MLYDLEQGKTEATILAQAAKNRMPIPERIRNAPYLHPGLHYYYYAFVELSTCRNIGMGEGAIPWIAVREYALAEGLDEEDFDRLLILVRGMDIEYLDYQRRKQQSEDKASGRTPIRANAKGHAAKGRAV